MSSPSPIVLMILASLLGAQHVNADTRRMQDVVTLLGIEDPKPNQASKDAADALAKLVERGLRSHPNIKTREAELEASRARVNAAQARYQPSLSLNASASQGQNRDMENDKRSRFENQDASLILRETLWRGGQDAGLVDRAKQDESLAAIRKAYEGEDVSFSVSRAALTYNFRVFRQMIDEASLADATELRTLAERKFNAGQVGKIDLHLTSMRESAARSAVARAGIETQQSYHDLLNQVGPQDSTDAFALEIQALSKAFLPYPAELPELKLPEAPSLNEQNLMVLQKRAEIELDQNYRARYLPQIDLVGTLGRNNSASWFVENEDQKSIGKSSGTSVQLQLSWSLWDRTQDHLIRAAAAEKTAAGTALDATRYEASVEAKRIQTYIKDLHKALSISREAYLQAGQLYDAQRRLYETGVIGIQPLMDAEREKRDAITAWKMNVHDLQIGLLRWQALQKGYLTVGSIRSAP